ncbi:psbP domain-containing protein 7, chloroplastic [Dioscorea cayenensis subsp. rotundata]|uniref:PsbP domain-containing protein 7, chloroplastic n=1 Tax=Dioscorea cayennensis subsp. rotundata TaxID=55577 RepID=A0AB40BQF8_DIOCR|nr:psbP domain-containing protein 7, chloroplastic [Dioscorea cayenensis subsp. rotundata]
MAFALGLVGGGVSSASSSALLPVRCSGQVLVSMAAVFRRRLLTGIGAASLVAVGSNFGGVTSFILGLSPDLGRGLRLDVLYPVQGFTRCLAPNYGFEFIYPADWVGDRTLLYRIVDKAEAQRPLDPPSPITGETAGRPPRNVNEPVVAFGPPGSTGELNVSVIVSPVPQDFSIESFGGPQEVGEAVLRRIAGSRRGQDVKATLVGAKLREDPVNNVKYYILEFQVESTAFQRHNVAVCTARAGKLFTLNAQAPESDWSLVRAKLYQIADSFSLTED